MNRYCFDTTSFIYLHKFYTKKIVPDIWKKFESMIENRAILAPMEVYFEIDRGGDHLSTWAKKMKKKIFYEVDEEQGNALTDILARYPELHDLKKTRFDADPFVVASAYTKKLIVITDDKRIQRVCKAYKIPTFTIVNFLENIKDNKA